MKGRKEENLPIFCEENFDSHPLQADIKNIIQTSSDKEICVLLISVKDFVPLFFAIGGW